MKKDDLSSTEEKALFITSKKVAKKQLSDGEVVCG
jgi:hypothetical protein